MLEDSPDVVLFTDVCSPGFGRYAGPYRIATELRDNGFIVQVVEYFTRWSTDELLYIVRKFVTADCMWIGLSTTFLEKDRWTNRNDNVERDMSRAPLTAVPLTVITGRDDWPEIVNCIRGINPNIQIVVGGAKAVAVDNNSPFFDIKVVNEGESSVIDLTNKIMVGQGTGPGARRATGPFRKFYNMPYNGYTDSTIRFEDNDLIFTNEHLPVEIARGCIFKCGFCAYSLNGKKLWEFNRTPQLVREDIEEIHRRWGSTGFAFCDDTYNDSVDKVKRYHREFMKLDYQLQWSSYARLDLIISHWETARLLYESGLRSVFFGVESLNHKSAKSIGKGMKSEKLKDGLYRLKEECPDLLINLGMIVGLPHDTEETILKNDEWLRSEGCPVDTASYAPFHLSPVKDSAVSNMSNDPEKYGYTVDPTGEWTRNDGFTKQMAKKLTIKLQWRPDASGRHRAIPFGRLQNIGYTRDDFNSDMGTNTLNARITVEGIEKKEAVLFNKYKERLVAL